MSPGMPFASREITEYQIQLIDLETRIGLYTAVENKRVTTDRLPHS
jgi:hypothetical protein